MEFIETPTFTKSVLELLSDEEYAALQKTLATRPEVGKIIPGSGGIRKMRWAGSGRGKRGGLRLIYFWFVRESQILMLLACAKSETTDLKRDEIRVLKRLIEAHLT